MPRSRRTEDLLNEKFTIGNVIFSAKQLIDYISIELPTNSVSYSDFINGQITGVHLVFVGPSISLELMHQGSVNYTIKGFSVPNKNITSTKNIANQLNSVLNQYIYVQGYTNIIATNAIQTVDQQIKLKTAIKNAIKTQIINSNTTFVINGVSYTANEIVNKIDISLPTNISVSNVEIGQIANVKLSYNGVSLKNTNNTNSFIVEGFEPVNENELNNTNIIKLLNSLLSNIIDVSPYYSMNTTSAADSLNDVALLDDAINSAIETEINSSINKFNFNGISYNASQIIQGISIKLPKTITLQDDETGQIPAVSLLYNGTYLKASNGDSTFIVDGFLKVSSSQVGYNPGGKNSSTNRNHQIANKLDSYLSQIINISKQTDIASMTAADALNAEASDNLKTAITKAIQTEIGSEQFNIDGIAYTAAEIASSIQIDLPTSISLTAAESGQIPNVTLSYNDISLTWKNTSSSSSNIDFIIEGFTKVSATQIGYNPSGKGNNTNRNHQIANILDSLLNQVINVVNEYNMNSYSSADALYAQSTDNLLTAITNAVQKEIEQSGQLFNIDGIAYTVDQIVNGINIQLPQTITISQNAIAQIPNVALSYNGISLTPKSSSSTSGNYFIIEGFMPTSATQAGYNPTKNNYQIYLENAITKWTASNEGVLNPDLNGTLENSSFNDLVKQNMAGYEILNDSTSFGNIKVSFTQLSSEDANSLGEFASDYWLTITATAINQINFTSWNANLNDNNGGWGTNTVESVPVGTIFTWTLPYALSTLTNNGNSLSLSLNNTYSNAVNNESLYDPFGLSIGKTSNLTSISSKWTYNYHGVIATNFGTNGEDYVLPSKWTVAYSQSS
ncbi:MAG: hypothetical protein IIT78_02260, partial [Mycoplasmataceae bacterium]|nr:hypothetical protein [Mycoplasmataceae bacterium]